MSHRSIIYLSLPFALLNLPTRPVIAQTASVHGPVAGFVFSSSSKTVRPLIGVPGATHVDQPVLNQVDAASIAPGGQGAFVTRSGQTIFVRGLSGLAPSESPIGGLIGQVDRVVWNRDGSVALLYSSSGSLLQRVQISGAEPVVDSPVDLSPWGQVTALALDPAGRQISVGFAASGLYLFTAGQSPALLSTMAQPAAAAFDNTGRRLYAVDLDQQSISEFDSGSSASAFVSLAQPNTPPVTPVGLAVSRDGRYLLLADSTARAVLVYDTDSRSLANTIPLDFAPSRLEPLSDGPAFLLNGNDPKEWLLILDASVVPQVYFVPASREYVHE
jgi:hypothetical protein